MISRDADEREGSKEQCMSLNVPGWATLMLYSFCSLYIDRLQVRRFPFCSVTGFGNFSYLLFNLIYDSQAMFLK